MQLIAAKKLTARYDWMPDASDVIEYPDKAAWLAGREEGLGSTDVAAAVGLSPYDSVYSMWARKVGILPPAEENRAMRRGVVMEPFVASEYALEHDRRLVDLGRFTLIRSARWPWLSTSPDRFIMPFDARGPGGLEIKSANNRDAWTKGTVPEHHKIQATINMAVTGLRWWVLAGYVMGSDEIIPVEIERDEEVIEALAEEAGEFWQMVLEGRAARARGEEPVRFPDPDASEATRVALQAHYRTEISQDVAPIITGEAASALEDDLLKWGRAYNEAKAQHAEAKTRAMALVKDRPEIRLPGGTRITWKTVTKAAYSVEAKSNRELRVYAPKK